MGYDRYQPYYPRQKKCFNVERACLYENEWINADLGKNKKVLVSDTRLS